MAPSILAPMSVPLAGRRLPVGARQREEVTGPVGMVHPLTQSGGFMGAMGPPLALGPILASPLYAGGRAQCERHEAGVSVHMGEWVVRGRPRGRCTGPTLCICLFPLTWGDRARVMIPWEGLCSGQSHGGLADVGQGQRG